MLHKILADLVVVIHLLFIIFSVFGGLLVLWRRWVIFIHLPAALWGALVEVMHWLCPLTALENILRQQAGDAGYSGGFIEQYVIPVIYPQSLTSNIHLLLGALVLTINLIIYTLVFRQSKQ